MHQLINKVIKRGCLVESDNQRLDLISRFHIHWISRS